MRFQRNITLLLGRMELVVAELNNGAKVGMAHRARQCASGVASTARASTTCARP
jgi:hypothetical protein